MMEHFLPDTVYDALESGDYITDYFCKSVQLIERTQNGWQGRKVGHLNDSAFAHFDRATIQRFVVKVTTRDHLVKYEESE